MRDPDFTLSAGPVTVSPRVLAALGSPIVYHYDPVFLERFRATERKLAQVFLTTNDVLLMQGEAVLGLEGSTTEGRGDLRSHRRHPRPVAAHDRAGPPAGPRRRGSPLMLPKPVGATWTTSRPVSMARSRAAPSSSGRHLGARERC